MKKEGEEGLFLVLKGLLVTKLNRIDNLFYTRKAQVESRFKALKKV